MTKLHIPQDYPDGLQHCTDGNGHLPDYAILVGHLGVENGFPTSTEELAIDQGSRARSATLFSSVRSS